MPTLTQVCLHAFSLSQELSSGPSLLSSSDARVRSAPSRQPLGVIHEAPMAGPPRRRQRLHLAPGGRCGMASGWHGVQEPRPSRRHGQHWCWGQLWRHGGDCGGREWPRERSPRRSLFCAHRWANSRPTCRSCRHVRARDMAGTGVGRGGLEVGRVVCGHRPGSSRLLERAERAPDAVPRRTVHCSSSAREFGVCVLAVRCRWSSPGQGSLP
jgi:hypothetical protein